MYSIDQDTKDSLINLHNTAPQTSGHIPHIIGGAWRYFQDIHEQISRGFTNSPFRSRNMTGLEEN